MKILISPSPVSYTHLDVYKRQALIHAVRFSLVGSTPPVTISLDPVSYTHLEWEKDPMGMAGGFMSQSIVTPEIDGAIRPFALFAQYRCV